jgi:hypothetical protein
MVYYTGEGAWTSPINFIDKVYFNDIFERYIPKFEYMLIDAKNYSQEDLLRNRDIPTWATPTTQKNQNQLMIEKA